MPFYKPLTGKKIVITRPRQQNETLASAVKSLGGEPIVIPAIESIPVSLNSKEQKRLAELEAYEWIAFTSANAVKYFFFHLDKIGRIFPPATRVAAVGEATARACRKSGLTVSTIPFVTTGASLAEKLVERNPPSSILLPKSSRGRPEAASILKKAGWNVDIIVCYETRHASLDSSAVETVEKGVDAAIFASPSAVNGFLKALPILAMEQFRKCICIPIGPTTRDELLLHGLKTADPPPRASNEALIKRLVDAISTLDAGMENIDEG